jgi:hypothetical protein
MKCICSPRPKQGMFLHTAHDLKRPRSLGQVGHAREASYTKFRLQLTLETLSMPHRLMTKASLQWHVNKKVKTLAHPEEGAQYFRRNLGVSDLS